MNTKMLEKRGKENMSVYFTGPGIMNLQNRRKRIMSRRLWHNIRMRETTIITKAGAKAREDSISSGISRFSIIISIPTNT